MRATAIDLFCGAGGLTQGLKQAGFVVLAAVELDRDASITYAANHPTVNLITKDIREIDPEALRVELGLQKGQLGLMAGCPPCQGFSTLRTKKKSVLIEDQRNDLIQDYLRFVEEFMPKAIMLENVPGLARDIRMEQFLQTVKSLGYWVNDSSLRVEDISNYGVPQRRRRLIFQASRLGPIPRATIEQKTSVRQCFEAANLPEAGKSGDILHDSLPRRSERVQEIIRNIPKNGGSRSSLPEHLVLACHKRSNGFYDIYGRMAWDDVAPTITGGCGSPSKGRFLHPELDRGITLREAALLQTFPKKYQFISTNRDRIALMIGNALPPKFIEAHARCIASCL